MKRLTWLLLVAVIFCTLDMHDAKRPKGSGNRPVDKDNNKPKVANEHNEKAENKTGNTTHSNILPPLDFGFLRTDISTIPEGLPRIVTIAAVGSSLPLLFIYAMTVLSIRSLSTRANVLQAVVSFAQIGAGVGFLLGPWVRQWSVCCNIVAVCFHYSLLVTFFWLTVLATDTWWNIAVRQRTSPKTVTLAVSYCAYAFGGPALLVIGNALMDRYRASSNAPATVPGYIYRGNASEGCWPGLVQSFLLFLLAPVLASMLVTAVLTIATSRTISSGEATHDTTSDKMYAFKRTAGFAGILGLAWSVVFIAQTMHIAVLWYAACGLFFLFSIYLLIAYLCSREVRAHVIQAAGTNQGILSDTVSPENEKMGVIHEESPPPSFAGSSRKKKRDNDFYSLDDRRRKYSRAGSVSTRGSVRTLNGPSRVHDLSSPEGLFETVSLMSLESQPPKRRASSSAAFV